MNRNYLASAVLITALASGCVVRNEETLSSVIEKHDVLEKNQQLLYIQKFPSIATPTNTTDLDTAAANVLLYWNDTDGIFTARPTITAQALQQQVNKLQKDLTNTSDEQVADAILYTEKENYLNFLEMVSGVKTQYSAGGYLAEFLGKSNLPLDRKYEELLGQYNYQGKITSAEADFNKIKQLLEDPNHAKLSVIRLDAHKGITPVGYVVTGKTRYLLVHDPGKEERFTNDLHVDHMSNWSNPVKGLSLYAEKDLNGKVMLVLEKPVLDTKAMQKIVDNF